MISQLDSDFFYHCSILDIKRKLSNTDINNEYIDYINI